MWIGKGNLVGNWVSRKERVFGQRKWEIERRKRNAEEEWNSQRSGDSVSAFVFSQKRIVFEQSFGFLKSAPVLTFLGIKLYVWLVSPVDFLYLPAAFCFILIYLKTRRFYFPAESDFLLVEGFFYACNFINRDEVVPFWSFCSLVNKIFVLFRHLMIVVNSAHYLNRKCCADLPVCVGSWSFLSRLRQWFLFPDVVFCNSSDPFLIFFGVVQ